MVQTSDYHRMKLLLNLCPPALLVTDLYGHVELPATHSLIDGWLKETVCWKTKFGLTSTLQSRFCKTITSPFELLFELLLTQVIKKFDDMVDPFWQLLEHLYYVADWQYLFSMAKTTTYWFMRWQLIRYLDELFLVMWGSAWYRLREKGSWPFLFQFIYYFILVFFTFLKIKVKWAFWGL